MASPVLLLLAFALVCAGICGAARAAGRRLRAPEAAAFFLLAVAFLNPGFLSRKTILPVDHAMLLAPWSHVRAPARYNANLNDAATQMAPWAKAVRMAWKEGSLPLRNRWNGAGMPLAANGQSAAFSPFTILMFPFALSAAFTLACAVKLFLAFSGTALWLSELRVSRGSAALGAVLFGLSFSMTPWLLFPHTAVLCLVPWALFAIELSRDPSRRRRALVLLTAVFLAWPLCGHPVTAVLAALFIGLWLAARAIAGDLPRADARAVTLAIAAAAAMALGLSAFLLIPEGLAIAASNRVRVAEAFRSALPFSPLPHLPYWPVGFLTALFPRLLGDAIDSPTIPGGVGPFPEMGLAHFGVTGAAIALLVLRPGSARPRAEKALLLPLIAGLMAATATWPVYELFLRLPGLRLMFVLRYFSWIALAGPAIAAFEMDRLIRDLREAPRRRSALLWSLAGMLALAVLLLWAQGRYAPLHAAAGGAASQRRAAWLALVCLGVAAHLLATAAFQPRVLRALPVLLAAVAAAELGIQGMRLYRFGSPGDLYPDTPMITFLRSQPGPFRIMGEGAVFFPNSNIFAGLEDIRTHDPVEREDYVDFLDRAAGYPPADYFKKLKSFNAPALDLLNVRFLAGEPGWAAPGPKWRPVYSGADGVVFENGDALPRVFGGSRVSPAARKATDGFTVSDYFERTNRVSFRIRVPPSPAPVQVVASFVQDGGWRAADGSGHDIPLGRAEGLIVSMALPPGDHAVVLRYVPRGFRTGLAITLVTAAGITVLTVLAAVTARRKRQRPPGSPAFPPG